MLISKLIQILQQYQEKHGDVMLYSEKQDGRSTWISPVVLSLNFSKSKWPHEDKATHKICVNGGY